MRKIILAIYIVIGVILSLPFLLFINIFVKKDNRPAVFNSIFLRRFSKIFLKILNVKLDIDSQTSNFEEISNTLIVANHKSFFDILILITLFDNPFVFISKKENTRIPFLNLWMKQLRAVAIDRKDVRGSIKKIQLASELIKLPKTNVAIFPQGTRNLDTIDFKAGSLKIAQMSESNILPIAFGDTNMISKGNIFKKLIIKTFVLKERKYEEYSKEKLIDVQEEIQTEIFNKVK